MVEISDGVIGSNKRGGRSGGRAARKALRSAPLAENLRPVRPGMEGGSYKPLKDSYVEHLKMMLYQTIKTLCHLKSLYL